MRHRKTCFLLRAVPQHFWSTLYLYIYIYNTYIYICILYKFLRNALGSFLFANCLRIFFALPSPPPPPPKKKEKKRNN